MLVRLGFFWDPLLQVTFEICLWYVLVSFGICWCLFAVLMCAWVSCSVHLGGLHWRLCSCRVGSQLRKSVMVRFKVYWGSLWWSGCGSVSSLYAGHFGMLFWFSVLVRMKICCRTLLGQIGIFHGISVLVYLQICRHLTASQVKGLLSNVFVMLCVC